MIDCAEAPKLSTWGLIVHKFLATDQGRVFQRTIYIQ